MTTIEEINDPVRLADLRPLWNHLLGETPGATFFQSCDWLECYWRHYGPGQRLRVLVVRDGQRPLGILPLVVRTERTRVGSVRVLTYPLHDWGTFYGPIGPNPAATLLAGLGHVRRTRRDWDVLDLRWVDQDGCDEGQTEWAMRQAGFRPCRQAWDRAGQIDTTGTWEDYWAGRDKKFRHNVDRCRRRLADQGEVTLVRHRPSPGLKGDGDPRWDLYDACVAVARRSWQGDATDGTTLSHPGVAGFLRDVHAAAARRGAVDLGLLLVAGRPVAFIYHYHYDGRLYGLRKGFDAEFAHLRPGLVLQYLVLEDGWRRGDRSCDLGVGSHDSKRHWQTAVATSYRFTHFPAAVVRAQLLRLNRWVRRKVHGQHDLACAQSA
ncbi:MAG: GNAT family N-acetyltransferase [Thermoguttaceae bacterium]|jgi:CelD/BcsL family acetyltransferase involved in cellulose biosynthesis